MDNTWKFVLSTTKSTIQGFILFQVHLFPLHLVDLKPEDVKYCFNENEGVLDSTGKPEKNGKVISKIQMKMSAAIVKMHKIPTTPICGSYNVHVMC